ncbi:MAG: alpha/beta hydrolase [Bacteroidota bacterium]
MTKLYYPFVGFLILLTVACQQASTELPEKTDEQTVSIDEAKQSKELVPTTKTFFPDFEDVDLTIDGINIHAVKGGAGPPLLLLHGAPESHVMWKEIAPELAKQYSVIAPDLRGYGRSDKPAEGDYSKRQMAMDQVALMKQLGYEKFSIVSHDRGSHVARRLAKDYPNKVEKMVIMDIIPATYVWEHIDAKVADRYALWLFWTQAYPMPEKMMGPQAAAFAKMTAGKDVKAGEDYAATNGTMEAFHAMCEDYRASKGIDMEHDKVDKVTKIITPSLVIWGKQSNTGNFDYPKIWQAEIEKVSFLELDCGHFVVSEKPQEVLDAILPFLEN